VNGFCEKLGQLIVMKKPIVFLNQCCIITAMISNERNVHLERLLEVVRGLTTSPDLDSFLQSVISEASELTNSELASILEYDESADELRFLAVQWFDRDLLRPMGVPLEGSAAGWVFRKGQPLIIQGSLPRNQARNSLPCGCAAHGPR
jgi:transcriptional regulator with GAF, ATPase, and Fis domain